MQGWHWLRTPPSVLFAVTLARLPSACQWPLQEASSWEGWYVSKNCFRISARTGPRKLLSFEGYLGYGNHSPARKPACEEKH